MWESVTCIFVQRIRVPCEFFTSTRKLLELSVFLLHSQSTQCAEGAFVVASWPLPSYLSLSPSAPSLSTWVESRRHLLGKYTFDVYFLPFAPPYFNICYVMYIDVPSALNAWEFSLLVIGFNEIDPLHEYGQHHCAGEHRNGWWGKKHV